MFLLTTSRWRQFLLLYTHTGFPIPPGVVAPSHDELLLLAHRRRSRVGPVHAIHTALRVTTKQLPPLSLWRGRSGFVVRRVSGWKLARPFRLEGLQVTPADYFAGGPLVRLDGIDAGAVRRYGIGAAPSAVKFAPEPLTPDDDEFRAAFHGLWSKAVWQDNYVKKEWLKFSDELTKRGVRL
ncbi:MAG: hypothetical protein WBC97_12375 [Gemmatimonadales bacterium]